MKTADWTIWTRDADGRRRGDPLTGWDELVVVERHNAPDTVMISGDSRVDVFAPGMGVVVTRGGEVITSGNLLDYLYEGEYDESRLTEKVTVAFEGDYEVLNQLCYPQPSKVLTGTPSTMSAAYDVRTGSRESLILGYVDANVGPGAIASRRVAGLTLPTSLNRGGSTRFSARMDPLLEVVGTLAEAAALRVRVVHDEATSTPRLLLVIDDVDDVSADVFFGRRESAAPATFGKWKFHYTRPKLTRSIVGAGGEKAARLYGLYSDPTAEALWGRRRETFLDQRQTTDTGEITDAGTEAVTDGKTPTSVEFSVVDAPDVQYRRDYGVGSRVGIRLPGLPAGMADNVVREATTTVKVPRDGTPSEDVNVVVGSNGATANKTTQTRNIIRALRGVKRLERSM